MNQRQINVLRMSRGVTAHFDGAPDLWTTKPILKSVVNVVKVLNNGLVQSGLTQQQLVTTGFTISKDQQLELMGDVTEPLIRGLRPLARMAKDAVLLQTVDFAPAELIRGKEQEVVNRCQLIHDAADARKSELADYGVTPAMIAAQLVAIDTFKPLAGLRDTVGAKRRAASLAIPKLLDQLREQFEILDDLVENLVDDEEFKATYRELRKITDTRANTGERKKKDDGDSPTPPAG